MTSPCYLIQLRVPENINSGIRKLARENNLSINKMIIDILEKEIEMEWRNKK